MHKTGMTLSQKTTKPVGHIVADKLAHCSRAKQWLKKEKLFTLRTPEIPHRLKGLVGT